MSDVHIVTVATESKYYFPYLVESCKRYGTELKVLGYGEKWEGFNWKFKKMIDYLKSLPPTDIVCFVDGYDVLCVRNINELKAEFLRIQKEHNCKIILATEHHDNSYFQYFSSMFWDHCKGVNINSGTYIGHVKDIYSTLTEISAEYPEYNNDDQMLLTAHCKKRENHFYVDVNNEMFFTKVKFLQEIDDDLIIKDKEITVNNKNKPFFVHSPSGYLDNIILKLEFPYDNDNKIKDVVFKEYFTGKLLKGTIVKYFIYFFLFIFFFIVAIYFIFITIKKRNIKKIFTIHKWLR